jgi:hypothetical protein
VSLNTDKYYSQTVRAATVEDALRILCKKEAAYLEGRAIDLQVLEIKLNRAGVDIE